MKVKLYFLIIKFKNSKLKNRKCTENLKLLIRLEGPIYKASFKAKNPTQSHRVNLLYINEQKLYLNLKFCSSSVVLQF